MALDSLSNASQLLWQIESERKVLAYMNVSFGETELFASLIFCCNTTKSIPIVEKLETVAGSVSPQQTLHGQRASAVKRNDGEQIPASKNGELAGSRQ